MLEWLVATYPSLMGYLPASLVPMVGVVESWNPASGWVQFASGDVPGASSKLHPPGQRLLGVHQSVVRHQVASSLAPTPDPCPARQGYSVEGTAVPFALQPFF